MTKTIAQSDYLRGADNQGRPLVRIGTGLVGFSVGYGLGALGPAVYAWLGGTPDGITAMSTVAIAGFTWALVRATVQIRQSADTVAQRQLDELAAQRVVMAEQVDVMRQQMTSITRQYIKEHAPDLVVTDLAFDEEIPTPDGPPTAGFSFDLLNRSGTDARIVEWSLRPILVGLNHPLPASPEYARPQDNGALDGVTLRPNDWGSGELLTPEFANKAVFASLDSDAPSIGILGRVTYLDETGDRHFMGFCLIRLPDSDRFIQVGHETYNYSH